ELIRRLTGHEAHALVTPLITTSTGTKFGKTEAGAIWLDAKKTSPYDFYQFWYNTPDADVIRYVKFFTLLARQEITELEEEVRAHPERRKAQARLADEVTRMTHGEAELGEAKARSKLAFDRDVAALSQSERERGFAEGVVPHRGTGTGVGAPAAGVWRMQQRLLGRFQSNDILDRQGITEFGEFRSDYPQWHIRTGDLLVSLPDLLAEMGLASSVSEATRLTKQGAITLDGHKLTPGQCDGREPIGIREGMVVGRGSKMFRRIVFRENQR
ncbi:MAG: hypothetical protein HY681_09310, partial [Chloroflexi bacterium]|nr:hypothetical protein [Chloroflexota bacterium]